MLSEEGEEVARFEAAEELGYELDAVGGNWTQVNALGFFTSLRHAPVVLKWDGEGDWELKEYEFRTPPWRDTERQERAVVVTKGKGGKYEVGMAGQAREGDKLRCSIMLEEQEVQVSYGGLGRVVKYSGGGGVEERVAVEGDEEKEWWVVKEEWTASAMYLAGLDDPGCYPDFFERQEAPAGTAAAGAQRIYSVKELHGDSVGSSSYIEKAGKGTVFCMRVQYWEYYTLADSETEDTVVLGDGRKYMRGVQVGGTLTCRGKWSFVTSGVWYGEYEVRRKYKDTNWELRGRCTSNVGHAQNKELSGDEEEEECYLGLFVTRSRYFDGNDMAKGFPVVGMDHRLVVEGYEHEEVLVAEADGGWRRGGEILPELRDETVVYRWSWEAFCWRYGWPLHCLSFNKRLVFASTDAQPQTLWFSAVDDLNNFLVTDGEGSAFTVSLDTVSQNPICWVEKRRQFVLLGTSECEWTLGSESVQSGLSAKSVAVQTHSYNGSAMVATGGAQDKVLYVGRGGVRVYEFGYSMEADAYVSRELNGLALHVTGEHGGVRRQALCRVPRVVGYYVLGDGQLGVCTYNGQQQVAAWGRWVTAGRVLDAAALPGAVEDRLYLLVERGDGVWIEVYERGNGYEDAGGADYESVVVTNALENFLERGVAKKPSVPLWVRLGADFANEAGGLQVRRRSEGGEEEWVNVDRHEEVLRAGWHKLVTRGGWQEEAVVGLRVRGKRGCTILALQG